VGDGIVVTVHSVRLAKSGAEMIVSVSQKGRLLLEEGKAQILTHGQSKCALPIIRDARTGKIIEILKGDRMAKAVSRVAVFLQ
jgi:hypothetical protein